jgi:hypothetical protein
MTTEEKKLAEDKSAPKIEDAGSDEDSDDVPDLAEADNEKDDGSSKHSRSEKKARKVRFLL